MKIPTEHREGLERLRAADEKWRLAKTREHAIARRQAEERIQAVALDRVKLAAELHADGARVSWIAEALGTSDAGTARRAIAAGRELLHVPDEDEREQPEEKTDGTHSWWTDEIIAVTITPEQAAPFGGDGQNETGFVIVTDGSVLPATDDDWMTVAGRVIMAPSNQKIRDEIISFAATK